MEVSKSRNLSEEDYFSIIQKEWLSYKVRQLIYEKPEDKQKFEKWLDGKKVKIDSYANRKWVKSIFTSVTVRERYLNEFFPEFGMPNFEYKNEEHRIVSGKRDKFHYFNRGLEVVINGKTLKVSWNLPEEEMIEVREDSKIKRYPYTRVSRNIKHQLSKILPLI